MNRTVNFAAGFILVWIIGYLLIVGRGLLIPLVIAIFIWHLLNTIHEAIQKTPVIGPKFPNWMSMVLALGVVAVFGKILIDIISNNVTVVIDASPRYQENLNQILDQLDRRFHVKLLANFESFFKNLSVQGILVNIYGVFTTITGSAVLIGLYLVFLFVEQHYFNQKLDALFPRKKYREVVDSIINHIMKDTQRYLGIKSLMSLMTSMASWAIMKWVGLDFAEFWALLIFFLNFIPNIGAIIATAFPALLALVQFQDWMPFLVVTIGVTTVQFIIGNFVEPKFLSKSLNLSPLVILFSLGIWGAIWGVIGMFLSVPITVMLMIIFAHFASTRPIAVILSQNGYIQSSYERDNIGLS